VARRGGFWFIGEFAILFSLFCLVVLCDWICRSGNCNWRLEGFSLLVCVLRIVVEVGKSSDASLPPILPISNTGSFEPSLRSLFFSVLLTPNR
jgi:hypothetical protein